MKYLRDLLTIPHLDLGLQFDVAVLQKELEDIKQDYSFIPYESKYDNNNYKEFFREAWSGLSLIGKNENPNDGITDVDIGPYVLTELRDRCHYLYESVYSVTGGDMSHPVRIMCIAKGKNLGWHSHTRDHKQQASQVTIQIPITMPEGFEYGVTTATNIKSRIPPEIHDESLVHKKRYEPGRAYVFNGFEYHNVFNPSEQPRYSIWFYVNVIDNVFFNNIIQQAVEEYDGPYI